MDQETLRTLFRRSGALLDGHFRLSSGLHSSAYLQCALVLQHPRDASMLGMALGEHARGLGADVTLSPALGGIIIGHEVARALGVRSVFAERVDDALVLRRGFTLERHERVLIVEDVVTTGGSTRDTMEIAKAAGAEIAGIASIVDRRDTVVDFGVPFVTLARFSLPTYDAASCPLCMQRVPISYPGSRSRQESTAERAENTEDV